MAKMISMRYGSSGSGSAAEQTSGGDGKYKEQYEALLAEVAEGKALIASAITEQGVSTSATASFERMAENILLIGINRMIGAVGVAGIPEDQDSVAVIGAVGLVGYVSYQWAQKPEEEAV